MKKILLVDDDSEFLELVEPVLQSAGYTTESTLHWEKVYQKIDDFQPELIILDIWLNGVDGRIICKNLKKAADTRHIPVVLCSAYTGNWDAIIDHGAESYLTKPFTDVQLLDTISLHLNN